jgi:hypothetical protein
MKRSEFAKVLRDEIERTRAQLARLRRVLTGAAEGKTEDRKEMTQRGYQATPAFVIYFESRNWE